MFTDNSLGHLVTLLLVPVFQCFFPPSIQITSVFTFVGIGSPHSLTRESECCSPFLGPRGETHSRAGEGGTQFRRRDRHFGTLCIL
jgi:hypothetical protein